MADQVTKAPSRPSFIWKIPSNPIFLLFVSIVIGILMYHALADPWIRERYMDPTLILIWVFKFALVTGCIAFLVGILTWLNRAREGVVISDFQSSIADWKFDGKAISDSLISEVQRIHQVHSEIMPQTYSDYHGSRPEIDRDKIQLELKENDSQEDVIGSLKDIGSIKVGDSSISIGALLLTLRGLFSPKDHGSYISGSLQQFGSVVRLVSRVEYKGSSYAWDITRETAEAKDVPDMVRDLAYRLLTEISRFESGQKDDINFTAKTWQSFKFFTESRASYYKYLISSDEEHLTTAHQHCLEAFKAEPSYRKLYGLAYNLAILHLDRGNYSQAEELLLKAVTLDLDNGPCYNALGHVYYWSAPHKSRRPKD